MRVLEVLHGLHVYDADLAPELLETQVEATINLTDCASPRVESIALRGLAEHGFGRTCKAGSEETPELRLKLALLTLVDVETDCGVETRIIDDLLIVPLSPLEYLNHRRNATDEVLADSKLPGVAAFLAVELEIRRLGKLFIE